MLEKTPESPLDCKESQPGQPKGDQSWVFIGRTDAEAETPGGFGHLMGRTDSLEKTLMLRKTEDRRRRGQEGMRWLDGIIGIEPFSPTSDLWGGEREWRLNSSTSGLKFSKSCLCHDASRLGTH